MFILDYDMEEERRRNETEVAIAREEGREEGRAEVHRWAVTRVAEVLGISEDEAAAMLEDDE